MLNESDPELLNTKPEVQTTLSDASHSYFLKTSYLAGKESKSYKLRLWMDENTPTDEKYMNKTLSSKIVVVSTTYEKEIDKTPPVANFTTTEVNGGYLVDARASTDDSSGISTYYYSKDGVNWVKSKEDNYVFKDDATLTSGKATDVITSIAESKVWDIYVKVEDAFENMSEVVKKNVKAKELEYDETIDNNLRYVGASPNNYVTFNNELWRIIGVMNHVIDADGNQENLIKIVRATQTGTSTRNSSNWVNSNIQVQLRDTYYPSIIDSSKNMINEILWHLGGLDDTEKNTTEIYNKERSENVISGYPVTWKGKIALLYPSDIRYSIGGSHREECNLKATNQWFDCYTYGWLPNSGKAIEAWLLPHYIKNNTQAYFFYKNCISHNYVNIWNTNYAIFPTLYLESNVHIASGQGTSSSPFQLELK